METKKDIDKVIAVTQEKASKYTYPIFAITKNKLDLIASSVIIEIEQRYYLITASHVITQIVTTNNSFIIGVSSKHIPISGEFLCSNESGNDNFDIAYIELDYQFIIENNIKALKPRRLLLGNTPTSCHIAFIHGYPNSKNKQSKALWNTTSFRVKSYAYAGIIKNDFSNWNTFEKIKENHTCMSYRKKSNNNMPTYPKGISGGGLWIVPNMLSPSDFYLDSILIEYHRNESIVFATKISQVINFIKKTSRDDVEQNYVILPS